VRKGKGYLPAAAAVGLFLLAQDAAADSLEGQRVSGVLDFGAPKRAAAPAGVEMIGVAQARQQEASASLPSPVVDRMGSAQVESMIVQVGLHYAGDPALRDAGLSVAGWLSLFRACVETESAFNPAAVSDKGAIGLGQLMPATATTLGVDPRDPAQNLDGAARYLIAQLGRFQRVDLALAAYNAGPDAVDAYHGIPPFAETGAYVRRVLTLYGGAAAAKVTNG
jgi:hypothetical protein